MINDQSFSAKPKALIDILTGTIVINNYKEWSHKVYQNTGIEWGDTIGDVTNKILFDSEDENHNSRNDIKSFQGWELTLIKYLNKTTGEFTVRLHIKGNPSKIYYGARITATSH